MYPSDANFILFRTPAGQATSIFEGLKSAGILIKNLHGSAPALQDCLRVTVGLPEEKRPSWPRCRCCRPEYPVDNLRGIALQGLASLLGSNSFDRALPVMHHWPNASGPAKVRE